jgi:hypothetical protein
MWRAFGMPATSLVLRRMTVTLGLGAHLIRRRG